MAIGKVLYESTIEIEDAKNTEWRARTGEPTLWIQYSGKLILLNGQPTTGYVLIGYIQRPTAMTGDSSTPDDRIPVYFHQYLKYAAACYLLQLSGQAQDLKRAGELFSRFTTGLGITNLPLASPSVKR